ncbi:hypothetical protein F511_38304 [Dorcoceras hygrometricum]|uniref:Splicing factor 3B subunit 1-like n=1 Tax=Dorcoceras hygrometricum TaxID=472368 RepID=A0A2Z7DBS1_9LAMI|nr:hypothetical protein F511_38304 [Dorcoceras hygrometricum]
MSLLDLQDVCIAIGSLATLDLPMVVDLIGIYGLKGPYSAAPSSTKPHARPPLVAAAAASLAGICSGKPFEENPSTLISSGLIVQADEGVSLPVVDLIDESTAAYREEPVSLRFWLEPGSCRQQGILSLYQLAAMASSLFVNTLHVCFDSVLDMDNPGIVSMFEALMESGLSGFLGCPEVLYEDALTEFFLNGSVRDGKVVSTIHGKQVEFSEELFASTFELPVNGLTDLSEIPKDIVFDATSIFSFSDEQAGSFDAVTKERFLMMAAINFGVAVNWNRLLFNILKDMVTAGSKQAKGYAIQISLLLENVPNLELGDSSEFPSSKILTKKTVHRYIAVNDKVGVEAVADVPRVKKTPVKKAVSRKRPAAVDEPIVKKKRTRVGKVVAVATDSALEAVPVQVVAPISTVPPPAPKEPEAEAAKDQGTDIADVVPAAVEEKLTDDESMSIEEIFLTIPVDCPLPYTSGEITKIQLGKLISIPGFDEGYWYKASLPKINPADKGKVPLQERDPVKGNPVKEQFLLIVADIELLVQLREQVIDETSLPAVATDFIESFARLRASIDQVQFEQIRRSTDADKLKDILLLHIRDLEKQVNARFDEHDRAYRALLTNIHKDIHDHKTALSLDVVKSHQRISTQVAAAAFDTVDVRKEVKELNAKVTDLDGGGNDKKGEDSSSRRPQPPPDDQNKPSGGSGSRADDPSKYFGGTVSREGGNRGGDGRRRGDSSGSSKRRRSSGGESPIRGIKYGPYLPPKRSSPYWLYGEKKF